MPNLHKSVAKFEGKVDRWQIYQWSPPALLRMDAGSAPAGTGAPDGHRVPEALQFRHTSIQTPETETTSHYWFCQARNFDLDDEAMTEKIFQGVVVAFEEDRTMIEAQQKTDRFKGRKIVTQLEPIEKAGRFYPAEDYHQDYHKKHGGSWPLPRE